MTSLLDDLVAGKPKRDPLIEFLAGLSDPRYQRGSILPIVKDSQTGKRSLGLPQVLADALGAFALPGDVYAGRTQVFGPDGHVSDEVIKRSTDLAGAMTLGAGAVPSQANTLRAGADMKFKSVDDLISKLKSLIDSGEYDKIGIRTTDDLVDPSVPSRVWVDGEPTSEFLDGLSTTLADKKNLERALRMHKLTDGRDPAGYYPGRYTTILGGYSGENGYDDLEYILRDAEIIGYIDRGG